MLSKTSAGGVPRRPGNGVFQNQPPLTVRRQWGSPAPAGAAAPIDTYPFVSPPVTLPAVERWGRGTVAKELKLSGRILLAPDALKFREEAELLADDLLAGGYLPRIADVVVSSHVGPHDIVLRRGRVRGSGDNPEAYELTADQSIIITAPTATGLFWGTRTLLQLLRSGRPVEWVRDWPQLTERTLMLDIGRKYCPRNGSSSSSVRCRT